MCWRVSKADEERRIEKEIKACAQKVNATKVLLLGTGNSGKSTFCKQLSLLYGGNNQYLEYQRVPKTFLQLIEDSILFSIQAISRYITEQDQVGWPPSDLVSITDRGQSLSKQNFFDDVTLFFQDDMVKRVLAEKGDYLFLPGGTYGMTHIINNLPKYYAPNFVPSDEDLVTVRIKTTGINETYFEANRTHFVICDVGGQRSERRKWIKCFSDVDAVVFFVAINEYDMQVEEARNVDALMDSLDQWKSITSLDILHETCFILFLNKIDLFKEKIKHVPLTSIFGDYSSFSETLESREEVEKGIAYFEKAYRKTFKGKHLHVHPTCILDQNLCQKIFSSIQDVIVMSALDYSGL
eukprot:TRINITY_DN1804_c1_g1_i4.p1 TRINITY_DN1804_c1_g1~~TRINITY_DN1804_c1_g1_i4.p1  ORF type:complete len:353 (-),score=77.17 TRINITY_DN1804_c1_g1_i4:71-1129(-)